MFCRLHEEDGGLLWKHLDWRTGDASSRRNRHLVVMFICTIANYTYGFAYKLGLDGTIEFAGRDVQKVQNLYALRRFIGVVFPLPVGLPLSIYDNVALAPRLSGVTNRAELDEVVESNERFPH